MLAYETRALATASRLINKYGVSVTWKQFTDGSSAQAWKPGATTEQSKTIKILFQSSNRKTLAFLQYLTGTEVPDGYMRALMAGNAGVTPALKDAFVYNGKTYAIAWMDVVQPGGNPLLYQFGILP